MSIPKIFQIDLDQTLEQTGCPICNVGIIAEQRHMGFLLHENANSSHVHNALHRSWGFCNLHAWRLLAFEEQSYQDGVKNAMLYEGLLNQVIKATQKAAVHLGSTIKSSFFSFKPKHMDHNGIFHPSQVCPICKVVDESQQFHLNMLVRNLEDERFLAHYKNSDQICLPHFVAALDMPLDKNLLHKLSGLQNEKLQRLKEDLTTYIDEHEYSCQQEYTLAEQEAVIKAISFLAGNHRPV